MDLPITTVDQWVGRQRDVELEAVFPIKHLKIALEDLNVELENNESHECGP